MAGLRSSLLSSDAGYSPIESADTQPNDVADETHDHSAVGETGANNIGVKEGHLEKSNKKLAAVISLFLISLFAFVSQTELTSYLYNDLSYNQPYLLLYLTHGSWWMIWPIQVISIAVFKHFKRSRHHNYSPFDLQRFKFNFKESLKNQHRNVFKTAGIIIDEHYVHEHQYPTSIPSFILSRPIKNIIVKVAILTMILSFAGTTWYVAMGIAPASDITAIYNCSAFSALVLAIPILHEKFSYFKVASVLLAIVGVFFVAYSGESPGNGDEPVSFPYRALGDTTIAFGALLYGLYEVLYKKLVCPPINSVSSKRLVAFSNLCASLIGLTTLSTVWIVIVAADLLGFNKFHAIKDGYTWLIIVLSLVSNLVYSLSFLSLMSLTSPVLSSVSSLITILIVGLFEWILFGTKISAGQLIGDLFVVVGFAVLSYSYWNEITEEDVDDDDDDELTDLET